jgi:hypothetical protein
MCAVLCEMVLRLPDCNRKIWFWWLVLAVPIRWHFRRR